MSKNTDVVIIVAGIGEITVPFASLREADSGTIRNVNFKAGQDLSKLSDDGVSLKHLVFVRCTLKNIKLPKDTSSADIIQSQVDGLVVTSKVERVVLTINQCTGSVTTNTKHAVIYISYASYITLTTKGAKLNVQVTDSIIDLNLSPSSHLSGVFTRSRACNNWEIEDVVVEGMNLKDCHQGLIDQFNHRVILGEFPLTIGLQYTHVEELTKMRRSDTTRSRKLISPFSLMTLAPTEPMDPINYVGMIPMLTKIGPDGDNQGKHEVFMYAANMGKVGCQQHPIKDWRRVIKLADKYGHSPFDLRIIGESRNARVRELTGMFDDVRVDVARVYGKPILKLLDVFAAQRTDLDMVDCRGL